MQEDAELVGARVTIQLGAAHSAGLAAHALRLAGLVRRADLATVGHRVRDFLLAHALQARQHRVGGDARRVVVVRGAQAQLQVRPEHPLVRVDRVVRDRVPQPLQVHADLVRAARQRQAVHDGVALGGAPRQGVGGRCGRLRGGRRLGSGGGRRRRVVRYPPEHRPRRLAVRPHLVQPQPRADLQDRLVARRRAGWELANHARQVFFAHGALADRDRHRVGRCPVLADEHHARCQPVEPVARQRFERRVALCPHDLRDRVPVVAARRVHRDAGRLVDHDEVVVFVHDAYGFGRHGRLVSMQGVRDDVAVLQLRGR